MDKCLLGIAVLKHDSAAPAAASLRVGAISAKGGPSKSRLPLFQNRNTLAYVIFLNVVLKALYF